MTKKQMELRFQSTEIRANEDGKMTISGYVNEVGQHSEILGGAKKFKEKVAPGAFKRAIERAAGRGIDLLAEHDSNKILASTVNGSLQLREDKKGLYFEADLIDTSTSRDYYELVRSGILNSMSFGFSVVKDSWRSLSNGLSERTVSDLELFEVSAVRHPAYSQSNVQARGYDLATEVRAEEETVEVKIEDLNSIIAKAKEMKEQHEQLKEEISALKEHLKNSENSDNKEEEERSVEDEMTYRKILNLKGEIR